MRSPVSGVGKMIEKSAVVGKLFPKKTKRNQNALKHSGIGDEAALFSDAESCKTKARGGNAGCDPLIVVFVNITAILDHARIGASLLPEKKKTRLLHVVQQLILFG